MPIVLSINENWIFRDDVNTVISIKNSGSIYFPHEYKTCKSTRRGEFKKEINSSK